MQQINHADILAAYICRLTLSDIEAISKANRTWTHAALNYGNSAQDKARAGFYAAVCNAVNNLIPSDRDNLTRIITQAKG